jgi:hypothetical protein
MVSAVQLNIEGFQEADIFVKGPQEQEESK